MKSTRPTTRGRKLAAALATVVAAGAAGFPASATSEPPVFDADPVSGSLTASGATFPSAFYNEAIAILEELAPDLTIEYAGGGSGRGRGDLAQELVDFAGTDSPVSESALADFPREFVYVPTVIAPVALAVNLDGIDGLNLTPEIIAGIFQLEITSWNDELLVAVNPDLDLPDMPIVVVRRAESSGTTDNFTRFLAEAVGGEDGAWRLGSGSTVEWPEGTSAAEGSGGLAQLVSDTPGAIGYLDLSDAVESGLSVANVQNAQGEFVAPTLEATTLAAAGVDVSDEGVFFTGWSNAEGAYPIAAQTWIIVYVEQPDEETAAALRYFLGYLLSADGQALAEELNFAPLPANVRELAQANVDRITVAD